MKLSVSICLFLPKLQNMFSKGQLIFALFFVIAFIAIMIWSYRKDIQRHKLHYKNVGYKVGIACVLVIFIFIVLRIIIH